MFIDAAQRQTRRLEGRHHERGTGEQFAEKTRQIWTFQGVDEHRVKLARQTDRSGSVASISGDPFFLEVALQPVEDRLVRAPRQFRDDACLEYAMREIRPANFLNAWIWHENAPLRHGLEPALRHQTVKHLSDALARNVKNRRQPMLWQFRSRRQTALEEGAGQSLVQLLLDCGAIVVASSLSCSRRDQSLTPALAFLVHIPARRMCTNYATQPSSDANLKINWYLLR